MERNGELVDGLLGVLGIDGVGGRCCIFNDEGLLQEATVVGALPQMLPARPTKTPWMPCERW